MSAVPITTTVTLIHTWHEKSLKAATQTSAAHHILLQNTNKWHVVILHRVKSAHVSSCIIPRHSLFNLSGVDSSRYQVSPTSREFVLEGWDLSDSQRSNLKTVWHCITVSLTLYSPFPFPLLFTFNLPPLSPLCFPPLPIDGTPITHSLLHPTPHFLPSLISSACQSQPIWLPWHKGGGGASITMEEEKR